MTDVKQKLIGMPSSWRERKCFSQKFEAGWDDDGQPVTNSELANRTNLHNATSKTRIMKALSTLALAAISFILGIGWRCRWSSMVDMGEEKIDGNPHSDDFSVEEKLTKDNDVVVFMQDCRQVPF